MNAAPDDRALPDLYRTVCLPTGVHAAVCITSTGGTALWLIAHHGRIRDEDTVGCACLECAPHEHPDQPVPDVMRARLAAPPRCGRPTATGEPCRTFVTRPGAACRWHTDRTTERNRR